MINKQFLKRVSSLVDKNICRIKCLAKNHAKLDQHLLHIDLPLSDLIKL